MAGLKSTIKQTLLDTRLFFTTEKYDGKVFCIGYNKTGTTTLGQSLKMLGYRNSSFNKKVWQKYYKQNRIDKVLKYTAKFESFDDLPWLKKEMIPLLDRTFPGSKFIDMHREEGSWKKSMSQWGKKQTGNAVDIDRALEGFRAHKKFIDEYFKDFPDDRFIRLDVKDPEGFQKLADFLGKDCDRKSFPHFNETALFRPGR